MKVTRQEENTRNSESEMYGHCEEAQKNKENQKTKMIKVNKGA